MERTVWTDERLDDRFDRMDERFDRIDRELSEMRAEMREGIAEMRGGIAEMRRDMFHGAIALSVGYLGLIAAMLARGL